MHHACSFSLTSGKMGNVGDDGIEFSVRYYRQTQISQTCEVQNPRRIQRIKPNARLLVGTPRSAVAATRVSCIGIMSLGQGSTRYSSFHDVFKFNAAISRAAPQVYKYACALFIIDGLGHATLSLTMPVSRSRTASF